MAQSFFHESYGDITRPLYRLIRKNNVSPADFWELEDGGYNLAEITSIIKECSVNGQYSSFLFNKNNWR